MLTPKQQTFCLAYLETGNASEAYRQAYDCSGSKPETVNRAAKQLLDNPKIATRLEELQSAHRQRHDITVDDICRQLDEDRAFARERGNPSAAVAATMGKAKLFGLLSERTEITGKSGGPVEVEEVSIAEKARVILAALAKAAHMARA